MKITLLIKVLTSEEAYMTNVHDARHGGEQTYNENKLKQLVLYVSSRSEDDDRFGKVKLNKLLFYSDFICYLETGKSITGAEYVKLEFGPCPKDFHKLQETMQHEGLLAIQEKLHHGKSQKRPIALKTPDMSVFSGPEVAIIERIINALRTKNGSQVSELSHNFLGWQLVENKETIPYGFALIDDERIPTQSDITYAKELLRQPAAERRAV